MHSEWKLFVDDESCLFRCVLLLKFCSYFMKHSAYMGTWMLKKLKRQCVYTYVYIYIAMLFNLKTKHVIIVKIKWNSKNKLKISSLCVVRYLF